MICLGVFLFGSNLFGTFCASWICVSISFAKLGKFSFIIFSKKFSICCFSSSPYGICIIQMLACLAMPQSLLILSLCFEFMFLLTVLVQCLFPPYVPNRWFESHLPSLQWWFPVDFSLFHLVWPSFPPLCCCPTQWVLWASWSPVFWAVHLIGWRSLFCLVFFFWGFALFFHLGNISLSPEFGSLPVFFLCIRYSCFDSL